MPVERAINVGLTPFNGGIVGSVLFIGTGGVVQQNNSALNWNNTTGLFSINNTGLGAVALNVFATTAGSVAIFQTNSITDNQTIAAYLFGNAVAGTVVGSSVTGSCTGSLVYRIQQNGNGSATFEALVLGTGDARVLLYINGGQAWTLGLDNSDSDKFKISGSGVLGTTDRLTIDTAGLVGIGISTPTAQLHVVQSAVTTGSPTAFNVTGGAHTTLAASVEASDVNLNLARTVQFATGAIATQRAVQITAPTYAFVAASTITNAATVAISGAPVAGTNATITNARALWVQSGTTRLDALLDLSGIAAGSPNLSITKTTDVPTTTFSATNATNAAPSGFIEITEGGTSKYIPFYA